MELKLRSGAKAEADGLVQLGEYMDLCGAKEGWLVIFDRRPKRTWDKRIFWRTVERDLSACGHAQASARTIHVVGA